MIKSTSTNPNLRDTIAKLVLWHDDKGIKKDFLGTCFAFPSPRHFLTARHCVVGRKASTLRVSATFGGAFQDLDVKWISCHPEVDLALLGVTPSPWTPATPFVGIRANPLLGEPFYAFGYSLDEFSADPKKETDRLFRGHIQRLFYFSSVVYRITYPAFELNIPCPRGLSGGPVFVTEGDFEVMGVATENLESAYHRSGEETVTGTGTIERTVYKEIINYGVALQLGPHIHWINQMVERRK